MSGRAALARSKKKKKKHPSFHSCRGFFIIYQPLSCCSAEVSPPSEESTPAWGERDGNGDDGEAGLTVFSLSCFKLAIMWQKEGIISSRLRGDSRDFVGVGKSVNMSAVVRATVAAQRRVKVDSSVKMSLFYRIYFWSGRKGKTSDIFEPSLRLNRTSTQRWKLVLSLSPSLAICDLLCPRMLPPPSHTPVLPTQTHTGTHTLVSHRPGCQSYTNSHPLAAGFQDNHGNQSLTPGETSSRSERLHSISTSQYSTHKRTHMHIFFFFLLFFPPFHTH